MTNQTLPFPGAPRPPRRKPRFWLRATPWQRAGAVAAVLVLPCCGGAAAIGAMSGGKRAVVTTAPAGLTPPPAAERLPGDPNAPKPAADPDPPRPAGTRSPQPTATREVAFPEPPRHRPTLPTTIKKTITKRTAVAYPTRTVPDDSLPAGETRLRTPGATGLRTRTYEITLTAGQETDRRLIRSVLTRPPVTKVVASGTRPPAPTATDNCDPNYTPCVPLADDVDCTGRHGDGPAYVTGPVQVIGDDIYHLDHNGDGTGCQP